MMHAAQMIAVVDKSGKVVSTSKHLINVFKEAKIAYRERKAEVVAGRQVNLEERRVRQALKSCTVDDDRSSASYRRHRTERRPVTDRHHSGSSIRSDTSTIYPSSHHRFEQNLHDMPREPLRQDLMRRHTEQSNHDDVPRPSAGLMRSMSSPDTIDMDLAYGEIPPPLPVARIEDENELKGLVGKVKMLLEEANCVHYSVSAIIASLQKDPDAMAAVALTLAEISNVVSKMAPGVLIAMKGSAPAVFALLASPQFLIAAGVGVGVTIVALGGYKIIKKIKAKNSEEDPGMEEMLEFGGDVNRIDNWRRGIAEVEEQSTGTSVDGEFITPRAAALSRANLHEVTSQGSRREGDHTGSAKTSRRTRPTSSSKSRSSKSSKLAKPKKEKKEKKPSPLRLMFS